jgi:hypothetical protein
MLSAELVRELTVPGSLALSPMRRSAEGKYACLIIARMVVLVAAVLTTMLLSCGSRNPDGSVNVTIDLNKTAPIGYEICAERPTETCPWHNCPATIRIGDREK